MRHADTDANTNSDTRFDTCSDAGAHDNSDAGTTAADSRRPNTGFRRESAATRASEKQQEPAATSHYAAFFDQPFKDGTVVDSAP